MQSHFKICILEALKGMEKVAEHINEMQRIHEEYGAIFDHLFRQHQKSCKQVNNYHRRVFSLHTLQGPLIFNHTSVSEQ
jgi:DNA repair ATPase RecN